ncbi:MAG: hypothetical protein Q9195_000973 [Heterodermia aff. obscurata]
MVFEERQRLSRDHRSNPSGMSSNVREWDKRAQQDWDRNQDYDNYRRGRSPITKSRNGGYRDRDRVGYRSSGHDSRSRSRSPRRDKSPYYGAPPSREVILEGLPLEMTEEDISKELKQYHDVEELEDVRVIRDRQTKVSRGFGFLRFSSLEKAKAFVERNYPMIYLYGNGASDDDEQAAKVRIAFSREREDRGRGDKGDGEWTCKICTFANFATRTKCYRCQTPQIDMTAFGAATAPAKSSNQMDNGASDASPNGTPSQFLLLRGLEPTVTEDLLAKGVAKLYKPSRKPSPPLANTSKKGSAKIASTTGDVNLGAKEGSLRRVLLVRNRKTNESWRYGFAEFAAIEDAQAALTRYNSFERFTISSKPVIADYVHAGIFVPVFNSNEDTDRFTFSPLSNSATKLAYWDDEAYVSELMVSSGSPKQVANLGETQIPSAADRAAAAAENEGLLAPGKESEVKAKKRKAETKEAASQKKTVPAHLQFWSNRHAELHGAQTGSSDKSTAPQPSSTEKKVASASDTVPLQQTFTDPIKNCCYLCSRQFKTAAEANKHERLSELHRNSLKNAELVSKAEAKMAKAGASTVPSAEDNSEYRDRAKERRAAFGASKKISLPLKKAATQPETAADDEADAPPPPSKGASLLGKMGWSAGEGLGAQGTGRTETIATDMYVQGVGLGAQGGKIGDALDEADRNTKGGYGDFLERTKDKAKARFESMN